MHYVRRGVFLLHVHILVIGGHRGLVTPSIFVLAVALPLLFALRLFVLLLAREEAREEASHLRAWDGDVGYLRHLGILYGAEHTTAARHCEDEKGEGQHPEEASDADASIYIGKELLTAQTAPAQEAIRGEERLQARCCYRDPEQEEAIDEEACDVAVGRDTGAPDEVRKEVDDVGECEDNPPAEELVEEVVCKTGSRQA